MASRKKSAVKEPELAPVVTQEAKTTGRSIANMSLSFGLVNVPVKLYLATDDHSISFRQVTEDGKRVSYKRTDPDGHEVAFSDIHKGYELPDGSMIVLSEDDFASLNDVVNSTKAIDVQQFSNIADIDPVALSGTTYYLAPDKISARGYALLHRAMRGTGMAGIATITIRNREKVCVVRPYGDVLILQTLNWADEIRVPTFDSGSSFDVDNAELDMAEALIGVLTRDFNITQYTDHYTNALAQIVTAKMKGGTVPAPAVKPADKVQPSMADALAASLEAARQRKAS